MSADLGGQATGRAVIYGRQHFHPNSINLRTLPPQLNASQKIITAEGHACLLRCWPAAGRLGLCLAIFPLDSWACGLAHACAVIKTLLISVSQLWYLCLVSFKYVLSCSVMSDSVTTWTVACSSVHGDSPGKNTRVGCHALLQGVFPTQGSNEGLPHCKWILYCLSHQGSPIWVYWFLKPNLFHTCHRSNCLESSVWETASGIWDSDGVKHTYAHTHTHTSKVVRETI